MRRCLPIMLTIFALLSTTAGGDEPPAKPNADAVNALRALGGNVMEIAQNDPRLDVTLHLADQDVTDAHLDHVVQLGGAGVVWLNLAGTKITDAGLAKLAGLKSLEKLHLEKTGITDAGLAHLAGLSKLTYLNLYGTKITDAGLNHLKGLKNLKRLYVWQTGVTQAGIQQIESQIPGLKVIAGLELKPVKPPEQKKEETKPEEKKEKPQPDKKKPEADKKKTKPEPKPEAKPEKKEKPSKEKTEQKDKPAQEKKPKS